MPTNTEAHVLWQTRDRGRTFLVPAEVTVLRGTLELVSLSGQERVRVDPLAIAPYEVTHEQARAWLDARFSQGVADVKRRAMESLRNWWEGLAPDLKPAPAPAPGEPSPAYLRTAELLARLTRRPVEQLLADPEAVQTALRKLTDDAKEVVAAAASEDVERIVAARDLTRHFHRELKAAGVDLGDGFADAPLRLRRWFIRLDAERALVEAADHLCAWVDRLEEAERSRAAAPVEPAPAPEPVAPAPVAVRARQVLAGVLVLAIIALGLVPYLLTAIAPEWPVVAALVAGPLLAGAAVWFCRVPARDRAASAGRS